MGNVHIRKQTIRLKAGNQKLAFSCRQEINDLAAEGLIRMFERIFSQTEESGQVLEIDSLKVDLGLLSAHNFTSEFLRIAEEKLVAELNSLFDTRQPAAQIGAGLHEAVDLTSDDAMPPLQFRTPRQQEYDTLLFYLENGTLPWWYKKEQRQPPDILLAGLDQLEIRRMLLQLKAKANRSEEKDVVQWITRLVHLGSDSCRTYIVKLAEEQKQDGSLQDIERLFEQLERICASFNISSKVFYIQVLSLMFTDGHAPNAADRFLSTLRQTFKTAQDSSLSVRHGEFGPAAAHTAVETTGFYIDNAGLILLHPFLPTFFRSLNLTDQHNQFISVDAQQRAAVLLYHLQCGADEFEDWNMVLNRILCGLPSNAFLPPGLRLTQTEQQESLALLSSVIQHWEALRGAGVQALQNTYILRAGKITYKEDHWLLQVERNGFDILIERLPWGIGTVKLPWLKELIYCEW